MAWSADVVHLYLDVDGVLNAVSWHTPDWDWPDNELSLVAGYPIRWSPTMVARLNRLIARPSVVPHWLTTWGRRAPEVLAPALGLDAAAWPVVGDDERDRAIDTLSAEAETTWWKLDAIRAHLPGETRAIWVDDDLRRDPEALAWVRGRGDVLPISPATEHGLTASQLGEIEEFVRVSA